MTEEADEQLPDLKNGLRELRTPPVAVPSAWRIPYCAEQFDSRDYFAKERLKYTAHRLLPSRFFPLRCLAARPARPGRKASTP